MDSYIYNPMPPHATQMGSRRPTALISNTEFPLHLMINDCRGGWADRTSRYKVDSRQVAARGLCFRKIAQTQPKVKNQKQKKNKIIKKHYSTRNLGGSGTRALSWVQTTNSWDDQSWPVGGIKAIVEDVENVVRRDLIVAAVKKCLSTNTNAIIGLSKLILLSWGACWESTG